jgi:hypothetical protein
MSGALPHPKQNTHRITADIINNVGQYLKIIVHSSIRKDIDIEDRKN